MKIARLLCALILAFAIFSGGLLYTFNQTKTYKAVGSLQLFDGMPTSRLHVDDILPEGELILKPIKVTALTDLETEIQTELELIESESIIRRVERRLSDELRHQFMLPYQATTIRAPLTIQEVLIANRSVERINGSTLLEVSYVHPDPMIAADVAVLFMEEYINYQLTREIDAHMILVEGLRIRMESLAARIGRQESELAKLKHEQPDSTATRLAEDELNQSIQLHSLLNRACEEGKLRVSMTEAYAEIIDKPYPPLYHYKPNITRNLSTSLSAGLLIGLVFLRFSRSSNRR